MGGGRESVGDLGPEELSPVLGITGKRLFNPFIPRLTGLGVSKIPSLSNHSVSKPGCGVIHR